MEPFKNDRKFENAFQLAFEGAEIAPSAHVWDKIEVELSRDQNGNFKKRIFAFQLVAAASLLFAASLGVFQVLNRNNGPVSDRGIRSAEQIPGFQESELENKEIAPLIQEDPANPKLLEQSPDLLAIRGNKNENNESGQSSSPVDMEEFNNNTIADAMILEQEKDKESVDIVLQDQPILISDVQADIDDFQITNFISMLGPNVEMDRHSMELQFVPVWVKKEDDSRQKPKQWASAGMSAGSYSPSSGGFNLGSAQADEAATFSGGGSLQDNAVYSDQQSGSAFSVGVGFGGRIARKWVLESGINYIRSEIAGTTNSIVESNNTQYPLFHAGTLDGNVVNVGIYEIKNSLQFISVPLKAGYILIDRKVGWVATGGFGSNILVSNSLESNSGNLEKVKFTSENSPYRSVSFSGIIGTEVYFNLTENYQLMIIPQYNFGITELTKAESSFTVVPNSFNIGVTFRYLLK